MYIFYRGFNTSSYFGIAIFKNIIVSSVIPNVHFAKLSLNISILSVIPVENNILVFNEEFNLFLVVGIPLSSYQI